jgi:hypothetical protein
LQSGIQPSTNSFVIRHRERSLTMGSRGSEIGLDDILGLGNWVEYENAPALTLG